MKETIGYLTDTKDPHVGEHPFPFADRIVGITRDWPVVDDDYTRGKEIDAYLKHHSCRSYVIIDDVQDFLPEQQPYFIHTRDSVGLDDAETERAVRILLANSGHLKTTEIIKQKRHLTSIRRRFSLLSYCTIEEAVL